MILRHVGITVTDLEESMAFYQEVFGFEVLRIMNESGEHIDKFLALSDVKVKTVKLKDPNGGIIELLKYYSHPNKKENRNVTHIGCSHIALTVENLDLILANIQKRGYNINSEPQYSPDGMVKLTFCQGPDGVWLELVEELN